MLGAIAGDIIGQPYEGMRHNIRTTDFPLFQSYNHFTDDSVLTVSMADAILSGRPYGEKLKEYYDLYPRAGYGGAFKHWARSAATEPYNSYGNGSAMRVSPVGWAFDSIEEVLDQAKKSAEVTHSHLEGIKGAQAVAAAVYLARTGNSKESIRKYLEAELGYDLSESIDSLRTWYALDYDPLYISCQKSVPAALIAFIDSDGFEDAIRKVVSIGGDSDTLACITGAMQSDDISINDLIFNYLAHSKEQVRDRARDALVDIGEPAVSILRDALIAKKTKAPVREEIARVLSGIDSRGAKAALKEALKSDYPPIWRAAVMSNILEEESHPSLNLRNWYPGDPHLHSDYSRLDASNAPIVRWMPGSPLSRVEGRYPMEEIADHAVNTEGLSWLLFTEHGPQLGLKRGIIKSMASDCDDDLASEKWDKAKEKLLEIEESVGRGCFVLCEELGTFQGAGHLLLCGSEDYVSNSWKEASEKTFLKNASQSGGFYFIAHPYQNRFAIGPSRLFSFWWHHFPEDLSRVSNNLGLRGFELLNGKYRDPNRTEGPGSLDRLKFWEKEINSLLGDWDRAFSRGIPVVVVGGSDMHKKLDQVGSIRTYSFLERNYYSLSGADKDMLLASINKGNTIVSTGPMLTFVIQNHDNGENSDIGGTLNVSAGDRLSIHVREIGFGKTGPDRVEVVCPLVELGRATITDATFEIIVPQDFEKACPQGSYVRIEACSRKHSCYTNPVFLEKKHRV